MFAHAKSTLIILLTVLMAAMLTVPVCATEAAGIDPAVAEIVKEQLSEEDTAILTNTDLYSAPLQNITLAGLPILRIEEYIFNKDGHRLETMCSQAALRHPNENFRSYLVFDPNPYTVCCWISESKTSVSVQQSFEDGVPTYASDLLKLSETVTLKGQECKLQGIYAFHRVFNEAYWEVAIYLQTDKGIFVRFYEDFSSPALLFTEEEFDEYASDYYAYISSYENNYNSNGEGLGGVSVTFSEFLEMDWQPSANEPEVNFPWVLVGLAGLLALAFIIDLIKKKISRSVQ